MKDQGHLFTKIRNFTETTGELGYMLYDKGRPVDKAGKSIYSEHGGLAAANAFKRGGPITAFITELQRQREKGAKGAAAHLQAFAEIGSGLAFSAAGAGRKVLEKLDQGKPEKKSRIEHIIVTGTALVTAVGGGLAIMGDENSPVIPHPNGNPTPQPSESYIKGQEHHAAELIRVRERYEGAKDHKLGLH